MEFYLFHRREWEKLYNNCSNIDTTPIPWEERRFVAESLVLMVLASIYYVLYIPCIYSFLRNWRDDKGRPNPCYQIMFYISVVDMGALWIISLYSGGQFLAGNTYCSSPTLNYFLGEAALSFIMSEAIADVILALDRCVDILSPYWSAKLFKGKRLWICWLLPATLYGIYYFLMSSPIVFNGFTIVFTNNPYVGFWDDHGTIFQNSQQLNIHQYTLFFGTPLIYTLFLICLAIKMAGFQANNGGNKKISKLQKNVFYQVFVISAFNMVAGGLYHVNEHFPGVVSPTLIFLAHFAWVHIHGIPPVIYLIFNQKIRTDVRILFMKIFRRDRIGHLHGVTVVVKSSTNRTQTNLNSSQQQQQPEGGGGRIQENENASQQGRIAPWTISAEANALEAGEQ